MLSLAPSLANLPFRGSRNYLHSTDLYPALTEFAKKQFSPDADIECLTIRQVISHQVRVNFDGPSGAFGSFRIRHGTCHTKGWLVETDEPISSRIPFDEATPMQAAVSGPGFALFKKLLPQYSAFESLIVLTKIVASQESAEHWWFCRIEFQSPLREIAPLECKLDQNISYRFLRFHIYQAGQAIGSVSSIIGPAPNLSVQRSNP